VSPERFAMETFLNTIRRIRLCLIAVDEAHCISEWGHDFRPDYLYLSNMTKLFPGVPIAAFTATATHRVQQDIINHLCLRDPFVVRASFNRPNLFYEVIPKNDVESQIVDFIRAHPQQSGIVYRTTRRSVESTVEELDAAGIKALPYHAGLEDRVRQANQEAFNRDEVDVVVATIAFGMGIDKPNVRFVLHGDLPKNMEAYYQETGRAGRDGEQARCVLFFGRGDIPKIRHFIDQVEGQTERLRQRASLNEMVLYASSSAVCRRRKILGYFGEEFGERNCETCDVCTRALERIDITRETQMILSAITRTGQRFGAGHIINIVCGAGTKKIRALGHETLPTYGVGKDRPKSYWREIVDDLMAEYIISQSDGQYPVLKISQSASAILRGEKTLQVKRMKATPQPHRPAQIAEEDPQLFERLRQLRLQLANERNVPSFVIFSDRTLHEMASRKPADNQAMRLIYGIGEVKLSAYGPAFLREIASYLGKLSPQASVPEISASGRAAVPNKTGCGPTVETTWSLLKQGVSLEEIARQRGLQIRTIVDHVESLILNGRDIDIGTLVPGDVRDHIEALYPRLKTGLLREIVDSAAIPVTFEQAKLVRAWIQSAESRQQPAKP
jgi:ATP-dependent DNA helicase RecQ